MVGAAGSTDVFWMGDFYLEAYPAYQAAMAGDWSAFLDRLPGYSGFTVMVGTPSALLTGTAGGMETMAYRLSARPRACSRSPRWASRSRDRSAPPGTARGPSS